MSRKRSGGSGAAAAAGRWCWIMLAGLSCGPVGGCWRLLDHAGEASWPCHCRWLLALVCLWASGFCGALGSPSGPFVAGSWCRVDSNCVEVHCALFFFVVETDHASPDAGSWADPRKPPLCSRRIALNAQHRRFAQVPKLLAEPCRVAAAQSSMVWRISLQTPSTVQVVSQAVPVA